MTTLPNRVRKASAALSHLARAMPRSWRQTGHKKVLAARLAERLGEVPHGRDARDLIESPQHGRAGEVVVGLVGPVAGKGGLTNLAQGSQR